MELVSGRLRSHGSLPGGKSPSERPRSHGSENQLVDGGKSKPLPEKKALLSMLSEMWVSVWLRVSASTSQGRGRV